MISESKLVKKNEDTNVKPEEFMEKAKSVIKSLSEENEKTNPELHEKVSDVSAIREALLKQKGV